MTLCQTQWGGSGSVGTNDGKNSHRPRSLHCVWHRVIMVGKIPTVDLENRSSTSEKSINSLPLASHPQSSKVGTKVGTSSLPTLWIRSIYKNNQSDAPSVFKGWYKGWYIPLYQPLSTFVPTFVKGWYKGWYQPLSTFVICMWGGVNMYTTPPGGVYITYWHW